MQKQKDFIKEKIIETAHLAFIRYGVQKTSMQMISQLSGIAVGNIYNYFSSKKELFTTIMQPVIKRLEEYLAEEMEYPYFDIDIFFNENKQTEMTNRLFHLVNENREDLKLLLFHAEGTPLSSFFDEYAIKQKEMGMKYIKKMNEIHPYITTKISPYFIQIICSIWFQILKILVIHNDLKEDDINLLLNNYMKYGIGGWQKLFGL